VRRLAQLDEEPAGLVELAALVVACDISDPDPDHIRIPSLRGVIGAFL